MAILALAAERRNISKACELAGISRSQFYALRRAYEQHGLDGLAPKPRRKPVMSNQADPALEKKIIEATSQYPLLSYLRLAAALRAGGVMATPAIVRGVWNRYGLTTRRARMRLLPYQELASPLNPTNQRAALESVTSGLPVEIQATSHCRRTAGENRPTKAMNGP